MMTESWVQAVTGGAVVMDLYGPSQLFGDTFNPMVAVVLDKAVFLIPRRSIDSSDDLNQGILAEDQAAMAVDGSGTVLM